MRAKPWLDRLLWGIVLAAPIGAWLIGARWPVRPALAGLAVLEAAVLAALLWKRRLAVRRLSEALPGERLARERAALARDPWGDLGAARMVARAGREAERLAAQLVTAQVQLLSFQDAVRGMAAAGGWDEVVDAVLLHCQRRYRAAAAACYWREEGGGLRGRSLALRDGDLQLSSRRLPHPRQGGLALVLGEGRSLLIGDARQHPLGEEAPAALLPGARSYLAVPLWRSGQARASGGRIVAGALVLADPEGPAGPDEDVRTSLEALADAAGLVLENVSLSERLGQEHGLRDGILQSLASGLVAYDAEGRLLFHNRAALDLLALGSEDLARCRPADFCPDLEPPGARLEPLLSGRKSLVSFETHLQRPAGAPLSARLTVALLRPSGGEQPGLLCLFDDLTSLRAMQDQIRQLDKLAAIGRFTSSLAHEIRNPLAGIAAGIDYLRRDGGLGAEQREYIKIISQEIERLDRIIRNLFAVARPGGLMLQERSLAPALDRVLACQGPTAAAKGVGLRLEPPSAWRHVECDEDQMQQVLLNLVKNAVEAEAPGGCVRIVVEADPGEGAAASAGGGRVAGLAITVENRGDGIPPEEMEKIFEPFYTRKSQGTGLGLFVCYNIVKQHGGTLEAQSEPGGLTRFRLWLPCTQPPAPGGA